MVYLLPLFGMISGWDLSFLKLRFIGFISSLTNKEKNGGGQILGGWEFGLELVMEKIPD